MAFYDCSPSDNVTDVKFLQAGLAVFAFQRPALQTKTSLRLSSLDAHQAVGVLGRKKAHACA